MSAFEGSYLADSFVVPVSSPLTPQPEIKPFESSEAIPFPSQAEIDAEIGRRAQ